MKKEEEKYKNQESPSSGSNRQKISQSLWCVFCSALMGEIEKTKASRDHEKLKLMQFLLKEHQRACHDLN